MDGLLIFGAIVVVTGAVAYLFHVKHGKGQPGSGAKGRKVNKK